MKLRLALAGAALLTIVGRAVAQDDTRAVDNLVAFTRLTGYVQYFHPSDAAIGTDWNAFLVENAEAVAAAASAEALAEQLDALFGPLAPTLEVYTSEPTQAAAALPEDATAVRMWAYVTVGDEAEARLNEGELLTVPLGDDGTLPASVTFQSNYALLEGEESVELPVNEPREPLRVALGGGVTALVPLAVFTDDDAPPAPAAATPLTDFDYNERATQLAAVAALYNHIQHFWPYWDVVDVDWDGALRQAFAESLAAPEAAAFLPTLRRFAGTLGDGHTTTFHPEIPTNGRFTAPFVADEVEGQIVVVHVFDETSNLQLGDVLLSIEGQPMDAALAAATALYGGVGQFGTYRGLNELLTRPEPGETRVEVERANGTVETVTVPISREAQLGDFVRENRPSPVAELSEGVVYVDLTRVTEGTLADVVAVMAEADALVFDLRGYPVQGFTYDLLGYLHDEPLMTPPYLVPVVARPDHERIYTVDVTQQWATPQEPQLTDDRVFLINGNENISFAESITGIVEQYDLGERVGSPTAGANGNVHLQALPGGYAVSWTSLIVTRSDGGLLMGRGIPPTIPAERTREGVAAGRDELLAVGYTTLTGDTLNAETIAPIEIAAPEVAPLTLAPYTSEQFPLTTVGPEGWQVVAPDVLIRPDGDSAVFALFGGTDTDNLIANLPLDGTLELQDTVEIGSYTWGLYTSGGGGYRATTAIVEVEGAAYGITVQSAVAEHDALVEGLLVPALEAAVITE